jgi:hypothetical protein
MKICLFLYPAVFLATIISSCGSGTEYGVDPVTAMYDSIAKADSLRLWGNPTPIGFATTLDGLDQQRVSIEGYIGIPDSIIQTESSTVISLWQRKGQRLGNAYGINVMMGVSNNQMDSLPANYAKTDLHLKDQNGKPVTSNDHVKITGIYHRGNNSKYGTIEVQLIEKLSDESTFDYVSAGPPLVTGVASDSKWNNQLVCADGYLIVPASIQVTDVVPLKIIPSYSAHDSVSVEIPIGTQANSIEDLPMNYNDEDVKIHDKDGKLVNENKVRVYGVWANDAIHVEYIERIK